MQRTERFSLVLSPKEKKAVSKLAEREGGLSQAALVRILIHRAAHEHGLWASIQNDPRKNVLEQEPNSVNP